MRPMTKAGDYLRLSAARSPDRACFVFADGSEQTFAQTNSRVNQLADALQSRGLGKGDRVAIVATDCGPYVEVLLACMKLGAIYVPLNNRLTEQELGTLLQRAKPSALFAGSRYLDVAIRLAHQVEGITLLSSFEQTDAQNGPIGYEELLASGSDIEPDVPVSDDDVLGLAFTSGTTGQIGRAHV